MPVSEKTVELNISRVVIEKCRRLHQRPAYSMGLTQAEEAAIGADVFIEAEPGWVGGFIQYKAMHRQASGNLRWNLNRTQNRDQHSLLCALESAGYPTFYCLPMFDDASEIAAWTPPPLWTKVAWMSPNAMNVPAPVDDHHHVECVPATPSNPQQWNIYSDNPTPIPGRAFWTYEQVEEAFMRSPLKGALSALRRAAMFPGAAVGENLPLAEDLSADLYSMRERLNDVTNGLTLLAFGRSREKTEKLPAE